MSKKNRLFKFLVAFSVLIFSCQSLIFAVPAYPYPIEVKQPDGQIIKVQIIGDEYFSYQTSEDGYVVVRNDKGYFVYSQPQENSEKFVPTDIVVHKRDAQTQKETNFLMTAPKGLTEKQKAYQEMRVATGRIRTAAGVAYKNSSNGAVKVKGATADGEIMLAPKTGSPHFLVFLFNYNNVKFTFTQNDFSRMLNETGYATDGAFGSATDFFKANSWNQFQPVFDVIGPIELPGNRVDYGGANGNAGNMFTQGAVIADQQFGVNFASYDYDNNGDVDNVYGFFAGYDEAQGGPEECVWSHASSIYGSNIVLDGKRLGNYACSSELKWNSGANKVGIGTFVHEFSHVLGLPDFYQTDGATNGDCVDLKSWSTLAGGCYNNDSRCPPLYGAMEREMLGWYTIPELTSSISNLTLNKIQNKAAYKIKTTTPNEYYIVEYREQTGFDSSLPGSGMLVFHVDKSDRALTAVVGGNSTTTTYANLWNYNMVNCIGGHACYDLIEANNINDAALSTAAMWPGSTGNNTLTDTSSPNIKSWAGASTNKPVTNISNHSTYATFDFMQGVVNTPTFATFYSDCNYGGYAIGLPLGTFTTSQIAAYGINNDDISSLKVVPGYQVTLYTDNNFVGTSMVFTGNDDCLVDNSLNDLVSSIKIEATGVSWSTKIEAENYTSMSGVATEATTDTDGGSNVGWIDANDWMAYNTINFPATGAYTFQFRVASPNGATLSADLNAGSIVLGSVTFPATGGWQSWNTVSFAANVNAGTYNLGVFATTSGWNFNWIKITQGTAVSNVIEEITGINKQSDNDNIKVFSRNNALEISGMNTEQNIINVFDLNGRLVLNSKNNSGTASLDITSLQSGMFFLRISTAAYNYTTKFIKK